MKKREIHVPIRYTIPCDLSGYVYQIQPPPPGVTIDIFFLELVAILSAIHHLLSSPKPPRRILLHTDSLDSVGVLNSLAARTSMHNAPVRAIAGLMLESGADIRVRHLTSEEKPSR
ncbi:hypothetical protein BKA70DRAFT_1122184 [Coprinopsis sp. MPI-PUGE-AT-0042]|nr:hypothetical protein BKA70DRAFT_1122184 [Coprinopsis sp. MPI-PUGE-AT-0042]